MPLSSRAGLVLLVAVASSCGGGTKRDTGAPAPQRVSLAGYAAQRIALTPAAQVRADSLGWVQQLAGPVAVAAQLDTVVAAVLSERGLAQRWMMPVALIRSYERNRTYAADPRQLAVQPLRSPKFATGEKYGEPLSSQLRTLVALHADVRFVLLPVELRFERVGAVGRAVLRTALLDARAAEARWVGDVRGDTSSVPARALASVAARLADLFVAP